MLTSVPLGAIEKRCAGSLRLHGTCSKEPPPYWLCTQLPHMDAAPLDSHPTRPTTSCADMRGPFVGAMCENFCAVVGIKGDSTNVSRSGASRLPRPMIVEIEEENGIQKIVPLKIYPKDVHHLISFLLEFKDDVKFVKEANMDV